MSESHCRSCLCNKAAPSQEEYEKAKAEEIPMLQRGAIAPSAFSLSQHQQCFRCGHCMNCAVCATPRPGA